MPEIGGSVMSNALVTGASGFIGQNLCSSLISAGHSVRALVRSVELVSTVDRLEVVTGIDIGANTEWSTFLITK